MLPGGSGFMANGDIAPCRFVKRVLTAGQANDGRVLEATALADKIVGISQEGTRNVPYGSLNDGLAAKTGENIKVHQLGEYAYIELTAAGVTRGDRITVDSAGGTGKGRTALATENAFAMAEQTRAASEKCLVRVFYTDSIGTT
jgi:N-methylhydantoinase B/oxoprolinase/acetone carboxylase alpha subunit